jgi:heme-degrading monooxygenase HmoA
MIARIWHGWARGEKADAYERLVSEEILPSVHRIDGFAGYELLRAELDNGESEFVTVTYFESLEAVRAFAGDDPEAAVVPPEARELLTCFDERSRHYEVLAKNHG